MGFFPSLRIISFSNCSNEGGKSHLKFPHSQEILFEINCLHTLADICGFYENSLTLYKFHDDLLQRCLHCQSSLGRLKLARGQTEGGWKYLTNKNSWVTFLHLKGSLYLQYFYFCIKVLQNVLEFHSEHCQRGKNKMILFQIDFLLHRRSVDFRLCWRWCPCCLSHLFPTARDLAGGI